MTDPLAPLLAQLHLTQTAAVLPAWLERAATQELSYADFLQGLLEEECIARANAATARRLAEAGFPRPTTWVPRPPSSSSISASVQTSSARWSCAISTPPSSARPPR